MTASNLDFTAMALHWSHRLQVIICLAVTIASTLMDVKTNALIDENSHMLQVGQEFIGLASFKHTPSRKACLCCQGVEFHSLNGTLPHHSSHIKLRLQFSPVGQCYC